MNPKIARSVKAPIAQTRGRHRREGGRPSGNSSKMTGIASSGSTKIQLWSHAKGTTIVMSSSTSPLVTNSSANAARAKTAAIPQNSHPMTFRGCRDTISAPTAP